MADKIKVLLCSLILIFLMPVLFVSTVILVNSYVFPDEIPSFFGWKPFIVLSGSMEDEIYAGDVAVAREVDVSTLEVGDVIAFNDNDVVITHRIVEVISDSGNVKYVTKGDNNNNNDDGYVLQDNVEGLYQFKVNKLGNFAMFLQTPGGLVISLSVPILLLIIVQLFDERNQKKYSQDEEKKLKEEIKKLQEENDRLSNMIGS